MPYLISLIPSLIYTIVIIIKSQASAASGELLNLNVHCRTVFSLGQKQCMFIGTLYPVYSLNIKIYGQGDCFGNFLFYNLR
jgi:hypothetical protein